MRQLSATKISYSTNKNRVRCSLCDSLLKASTAHRYLLAGKSIHDHLDKDITYNDCCQRYLNGTYELNKLKMICLKCCQDLQQINSLYKNAEELKQKIRNTWKKTKRLNRARHSGLNFSTINENISSSPLPTVANDDNMNITVKEEVDIEEIPATIEIPVEQSPIAISETVLKNNQYDLSNTQVMHTDIHPLNLSHPFSGNHHEEIEDSIKKPRVCLININANLNFDLLFFCRQNIERK